MRRTELLQEIRKMRFEEVHSAWTERRLTQEEAARLLGICKRTFRRYINRYEEEGLDGLIDKRLGQVSHRKAPDRRGSAPGSALQGALQRQEYQALLQLLSGPLPGRAQLHLGAQHLQKAGLVKKAPGRGKHRRRRERAPMAGMMLHQDCSTHERVSGHHWDLIITLDDATSEHYSMFFVEEEGTASNFQAMRQVITAHNRGALQKAPGGGRSTSYSLVIE